MKKFLSPTEAARMAQAMPPDPLDPLPRDLFLRISYAAHRQHEANPTQTQITQVLAWAREIYMGYIILSTFMNGEIFVNFDEQGNPGFTTPDDVLRQ